MAANASEPTLLEGIVDTMGDLLGDKAGQAAFQFAAHSEGKRMAAGYGPADVGRLQERLDTVLGQRSTIEVDRPDELRLTITESRLLNGDRPVLEAIALGLIEGAYMAVRGRKQRVAVVERRDDAVVVEVKSIG